MTLNGAEIWKFPAAKPRIIAKILFEFEAERGQLLLLIPIEGLPALDDDIVDTDGVAIGLARGRGTLTKRLNPEWTNRCLSEVEDIAVKTNRHIC